MAGNIVDWSDSALSAALETEYEEVGEEWDLERVSSESICATGMCSPMMDSDGDLFSIPALVQR